GAGYLGQVDVGRYLAGDVGGTLSIDRVFENGFRVGAFATLTSASAEEFGEGSFDKGIRFTIPGSFLTGEAGSADFADTIRPVTRDGGARLRIEGRLHEVVRPYGEASIAREFGSFLR
ncbi:MAG: YjbH domain-containing protein, partial [Hasllibacter sp.]